jgi:hypothetical protein
MLAYQAHDLGFGIRITQIKTYYEVQFSINPILKEKIHKKFIKNNLSQLGLIHQTHDS